MEKKYINTNKYKKVSSDNRKRRSENLSKNLRGGSNLRKENSLKEERKKSEAPKPRRPKKRLNIFNIFLVICILVLGLCALRLALKEETEPFFNIFGVKIAEKSLENLKIAIVDNTDVLDNNSKNIVLTELNNYTYGTLLRITQNYEIEFELLESVEKQDNKTYILKISNENTLTSSVLKSRLSIYMSENSKYYENLKNVESIEEVNNKEVKVTLKESDPLFVYNLQLPITFSTLNTGMYNASVTRGASSKVTYLKKSFVEADIPNSISLVTVKNDDEAIEMLKSENIDCFFTDSYDLSEKLGKTEVDIHSYSNGKCLFLIGNKESEVFSKKEVRQAMAYSIDREKIRKEVYLNSGTVIDIPELYSETKFKYDIYGAQNLLLSSGYTLDNNVFTKDGIPLEVTILVQKSDETKSKVAMYIKSDLEKIGIKVNVLTLSSSEIEKIVKLGNYDLVLSDISLNENPSISFIQEYITVSDKVEKKIKEIEDESDITKLSEKVNSLISTLSDEIVCIGIHADTTYVVSKKGLSGFSNIKYMNIFSDILLSK